MNDLSNRISNLTPEQRLLLGLLRKEQGVQTQTGQRQPQIDAPAPALTGFSVRPNAVVSDLPDEELGSEPFGLISEEDRLKLPEELEDAYPLTVMQVGMLTHMELRKNSPTPPAYHNVNSFRLRGPFNAAALQEAVNLVVARHPVLRTSFDLTNYSEPLQLVHRSAELPVVIEDLRGLSEAEREARLKAFIERENYRLFDVTRAPLLRYFAHRLTDDTFQFTLVEPHSISDGWSTNLTLTEVGAFYHALFQGRKPPEEPLPVTTFRDFVALERKTLQSSAVRRYWENKLSEWTIARLPRWPRQFHAPATIEDHKVSYIIPPGVVEGLYRLARAAGAPIKSALLAAHLKVMSLITNQERLVTGLVFNSRPEVLGGDKIHGMYLNTLPLPFALRGGTWLDLVKAAYDAETEMIPYRRYPLAELQKNWGNQYLYESAFTFLNFHSAEEVLRSGTIEDAGYGGSDLSVTNFLLMVNFTLSAVAPNRIGIELGFDINEFTREQMKLLLSYYDKVMAAMAASPSSRHERECFLPTREKRALLVDWNNTAADYPKDLAFTELFEAQVEKAPEAVAVTSEGRHLSYRELNSAANRLARRLAELGVGPDTIVALLANRGINFLISIIAIFKAGGAYLPLDPAHPLQRLASILSQGRIRHMLVGGGFRGAAEQAIEMLSDGHRPVVIDIEEPLERRNEEAAPAVSYSPQQLAYVIFTSGSTGAPKGVMAQHQGMLNHLYAKIRDLDLGSGAVVAQTASQCFDISVWQFLAAFLVGGRICVFDEATTHDPSRLLTAVEREGITIFETVPSMLRLLLEEVFRLALDQPRLARLRSLIATGEALPPQLCRQWLAAYPEIPLLNAYGPTECSDDVTHHVIAIPPTHEVTNIPIGRPVANTRLYVLDHELQPVPTGVSAELYVAGDGVCRGYVERPEITAEKFIPDPFSRNGGERLYRTGDVVRRLPDASLEFFGRRDEQIKLRGYRIELGEIEVALANQNGVREAAVVLKADEGAEARLVAYVVRDEGGNVSGAELTEYLRGKLPSYMTPAGYVFLSKMPLTPNGKVDRSALLESGNEEEAHVERYQAPRNETEELVAGIWAELLRLDRVSVNENFFDLGGHSILTFQMVTRLRKAFGVDVSMSSVFETGTVAGLSRLIDAGLKAEKIVEPLRPVDREGGAPLSYEQESLWVVDQVWQGASAYNIPAAVRVRGPLQIDSLNEAVAEIVRRQEILRATFHLEGGKPKQRIENDVRVKVEVLDLRDEAGHKREERAERELREEIRRPFDLAKGPLMRVKVMVMGEVDHIIALTVHHIVSDGWSMRIMVREMATLYEAKRRGVASGLNPLAIQYADYAVWKRKRFESGGLNRELSYWMARLNGSRPTEVRPDHQRGAVQSHRGATRKISISKDRLERLREIGRREEATLFMVLLAAWKSELYAITGCEDVVVGTNVANRGREETEGLVGFFVNQVALRTDLKGQPGFKELLTRVKKVCLGAYANSEAPFEKVVEAVGVKREANRSPLFQIKVDYGRAEGGGIELEGVSFSEIEIELGATHFDLTLYLEESDDELSVRLQYNTDLYGDETINSLLNKYNEVFSLVAENSEITVTEIAERLRSFEKRELERAKRRLREEHSVRLKGARRKTGG